MSEDTSTISTKEPLPDGLEEKAIEFYELWLKGPEHRKAMDQVLKGLNPAQTSLVSRRAQRFSAGEATPKKD